MTHQEEQEVATPMAEQSAQTPSARRRVTRPVLITAVAVLLVGSAGTAFGVDRHAQAVAAHQLASATVAHTDAMTALASDRSDFTAALTQAKTVLASIPAAGVADQATVTALQTLVDQAASLDTEASTAAPVVPGHATAADIGSATSALNALRARLSAAVDALKAATTAVNDSHEALLLKQATQGVQDALAALNGQIGTAQQLLDASAGKVSDDTVRQALDASIKAASTAAGTPKETTVDGLNAQVKTLTDAKADVAAKAQAVSDAQSVWQQAQDAAAAHTATSGTSAAKSGTGAKSSPLTKGSTGTTSAGSSSASTGATGSSPSSGPTQVTVQTRPVSTPAEAIAGLTGARAAAGLQTVASCDAIPGSVMGGVGIVHAIAWDEFLTSPDHRAIVMVPKPAVLQAWNAADGTGTMSIYVKVSACIVPS